MNSLRNILSSRIFSSNAGKATEEMITKLLINRFPKAVVEVTDVSGGCGAMFEVYVEAKEFQGLNLLKQHKMVTTTLKEQMETMHGIRIHTSTPK